ncbi:unnamed protein product, partial [Prorocentrum cordatum]
AGVLSGRVSPAALPGEPPRARASARRAAGLAPRAPRAPGAARRRGVRTRCVATLLHRHPKNKSRSARCAPPGKPCGAGDRPRRAPRGASAGELVGRTRAGTDQGRCPREEEGDGRETASAAQASDVEDVLAGAAHGGRLCVVILAEEPPYDIARVPAV